MIIITIYPYIAVNIINCMRVSLKLPLATKFLHQPVMKPILLGEEVAQRTLREIPSGSCLQFRLESYPLYTRYIRRLNMAHQGILVSVNKPLPVGLASWHCCSAAPSLTSPSSHASIAYSI